MIEQLIFKIMAIVTKTAVSRFDMGGRPAEYTTIRLWNWILLFEMTTQKDVHLSDQGTEPPFAREVTTVSLLGVVVYKGLLKI